MILHTFGVSGKAYARSTPMLRRKSLQHSLGPGFRSCGNAPHTHEALGSVGGVG